MTRNGNGDVADLTLRMVRKLGERMDKLGERMDRLDQRMDKFDEQMTDMRQEMRTGFQQVRDELGGRIDVLSQALRDGLRVHSKRIRRVEDFVGLPRAR